VAEYKVVIKPSAFKELDAVGSKRDRARIVARIWRLAQDPQPLGSEKLGGRQDRFRVRQGDYRIVYSVDDQEKTVMIVKIGHRREVYR